MYLGVIIIKRIVPRGFIYVFRDQKKHNVNPG